MSVEDNNNAPENNGEGAGNGGADQTIEINGQQLSIDQAKDLVEAGKAFKELTEQYPDIDFKELPKSFTQTRQDLSDLKKSLEKKDEAGEITVEEKKRLASIDAFFDDPHVQARLKTIREQDEQKLKEDLEFQKTREGLEAEFDGSDGRPKFDYVKVLEYGKENGIFNLRKAYESMHYDALVDWKVQKKLEKKYPGTFSEKRPGAGSQPPAKDEPKDFREATAAALADAE